ncbi:hypothetical protein [Paenibacillus sp. N3.4]|uniref:hypothetical protein n=1 Tax=Paenibacillus sp. N3.4 TaxID=2603222 RepID=UPI0011C89161|nr:hypothetical protein [Paenibacillus sp. N3.4]TXK76921.1 hypothetical protein FU659_24395 [Paenibacillus sp. N3.4]
MSQQKASPKRDKPSKEADTPQQPTGKPGRTSGKAAAARQEIPLQGTESMSRGWQQLYRAISKEVRS